MWNVLSSRICSSGTSPAPASSQGGVFPISMPVLSIYVAQGIQVGVYPLHTRRTFPISFSLSQDSSRWIQFYPSLKSQLSEAFLPLFPLFLSLLLHLLCILFSFSTILTNTWFLSLFKNYQYYYQCFPSITAVRGVQGAAGKLRPTGGCTFADRETMEETGRGQHRSHRPKRAWPATSPTSPYDLGDASQSRIFHQEASSLLQMPR